MQKLSFDAIRREGLLLYEYVRGSTAQGTAIEGKSDVDTAGVFIEPLDWLLGTGIEMTEQVADLRNDTVWYALGKYMTMLTTSNPTVLESMFVDRRFVLYEHPLMSEIKRYRDMFITKECFKSFIGYAESQIRKCQGLHKKCNNPITKRLGPLDFAYTFHGQGSTHIVKWLSHRGLKQEYCGLVNVPNMRDAYSVFYDWGNHYMYEGLSDVAVSYIQQLFGIQSLDAVQQWISSQPVLGYSGIVGRDGQSNELRLSPVLKDQRPICHLSYNKDGYSMHCRQWREFKQWERERNPERYLANVANDKGYDAKNVAHSIRLLHMGIEIAKTGRVNVDRTNIDRDILLRVRKAEFSYDQLIEYLQSKKDEMEDAIAHCALPESIDRQFVNQLLIDIRTKFYDIKHR